jgi:small conductance mechanosensitive channel
VRASAPLDVHTGIAWLDALVGTPLKVLGVLLVAVAVRLVVHRFVDRIAEGIATGRVGLGRLDEHLPTATAILAASPLLSERRQQRARTIASVLNSATTAVVAVVTVPTVLSLLTLPTAPLLASAGAVGVALGLGAQSLVKDVLGGLFMIVEDQYGVGDLVDLGPAHGVVESVGLRVTRLRDGDGTVWYLRNGEISRVGNRSQGWARAVLDVGVAPGADLARVRAVLLGAAQTLVGDADLAGQVLEEPEVWGVEAVSREAVVLRLVVRTAPMHQWTVARVLRARIVAAFEADGLGVPVELEGSVDPSLRTAAEAD